MSHPGLRANLAPFALLVLINAFVGAMVGMERSVLPLLAEEGFGLATASAVLSFLIAFGLTKAGANFAAGRLADAWGRRPVLIAGWLVALPVPLLLGLAGSWWVIVAANALLGLSQGLAWSATVIMKIDLAGPRRRGLAMGLNEFAGYLAVGLSALLAGTLSDALGVQPTLLLLGLAAALPGALLSLLLVGETRGLLATEAPQTTLTTLTAPGAPLPLRQLLARATLTDPTLSAASQAGFINNLNDGMAWGLLPLVFLTAGLSDREIGWLAGLYPAVWGLGQLLTGPLSDRIGRRPLIVWGMAIQAAGIGVIAMSADIGGFALGSVLMGGGTAMVYPSLLAAVGDAAAPAWRAGAVGVYRLWRDLGYVAGALTAGVLADLAGMPAALWTVAGLTLLSGILVRLRMPGRLIRSDDAPAAAAVLHT